MLINEAVYNIRERIRQLADDSSIDDREIIFELNNQRSLFYRNQYNQRNRIIDEDIKQTITLTLEETTEISDCETSNCTILRSSEKMPRTIELHHKNAIIKAYGDISSKPFSLITWNQFYYAGNGEYSKNEVFVAPKNDYLYIKSASKLHRLMSKIYLDVILENPLDIKDYCSGDDCFDKETFEYPIKRYAFSYIAPQVTNVFLSKLQVPEDKFNNAENDEIAPQ